MSPNVKFKRIHLNAKIPTYAKPGDAGMDLCNPVIFGVRRGELIRVPLGVAVEIPEGFEGQIRMRSSLAKDGFFSTVNPGTIDSGYRGELSMLLGRLKDFRGDGGDDWIFPAGSRICQLVIAPVARAEMVEADELSPSERGTGGFGSTGT